jgi:hypothetical protein
MRYVARHVDILGAWGDEQPDADSDRERRFDELSARVDANRIDIDDLTRRANASNHRARVSDEASAEQDLRISHLEARTEIDRDLIAQLQADGLLALEHAAHLEEALRSARLIGAAMGIVMAGRKVTEAQAFAVPKMASQRSNQKLRVLAEELVRTGDPTGLPEE